MEGLAAEKGNATTNHCLKKGVHTVPTYNRSVLLGHTLHSLVLQDAALGAFEVIVVDDGSSDNTRDIVARFSTKLPIRYLYQDDLGYRVASARNLGIRAASGATCLFVDSGVMLHRNCILEHIRFHSCCSSDRAALGYVYGFEENEVLTQKLLDVVALDDPSGSIEILRKDERFADVPDSHYKKYNDHLNDLPAPWIYFWTCHVSVLRRNLLSVNLFDVSYDGNWGVEDNDIGFRLWKTGISIEILRSATSLHYPHPKNKESRHLEGYLNCKYFNNKFSTPETNIFLNNYMSVELFDVNAVAMKKID